MAKLQKATLNAQQIKKLEKQGLKLTSLADIIKLQGGPELGFLSLEYLLCSNVLLLSTIYQIHGKEKSGKSTILMDWLGRYFLNNGGNALLIDTENKVSTSLLQKVIGENANELDLQRTTIQERAQALMTEHLKGIRRDTFQKKKAVMLGMGLDSYNVTSEATSDGVDKTGHSQKQFSTEANLWSSYLPTVVDKLTGAPVSLFVINHTREKQNVGSFTGPVEEARGGRALKYFQTYQFKVSGVGSVHDKSKEINNLCIKSDYNSYGPAGRKIYPRIVFKQDGQDDNVILVDWEFADIQLLTGPDFPRAQAQKLGICDVKESATKGLFSDKILGLTNVPFSEIKAAIYNDKERLKSLRDLLGIVEYRTMDDLLDDNWFFDGGACGKDDEEGDDD
jgi:RecA/RadA recombinase